MKMSIDELVNNMMDAVWNAVELYNSEYESIEKELRLQLEKLKADGKL